MSEVKKPNNEKKVVDCALLILNEEKIIRGKKIEPGTVLGIVSCEKGFTIEDIDLGMQLNQVGIKKEE